MQRDSHRPRSLNRDPFSNTMTGKGLLSKILDSNAVKDVKNTAIAFGTASGKMNPLTAPAFKGEKHAVGLSGADMGSLYNFMGPSTQLDQRVARGDKPINMLDAAAFEHDNGYNVATTPAMVRAADILLLERVEESKDVDPKLAKLVKTLFVAKMFAEDLPPGTPGYMDPMMFIDNPDGKPSYEEMSKKVNEAGALMLGAGIGVDGVGMPDDRVQNIAPQNRSVTNTGAGHSSEEEKFKCCETCDYKISNEKGKRYPCEMKPGYALKCKYIDSC
jgi:hypothetical protein